MEKENAVQESESSREDYSFESSFGTFDVVKFLPAQPDPSKSVITIHGAVKHFLFVNK